ncbi:MAG: hypothetical protein PW788_09320 [Micavibrio sp.]|nr:hypothetical protein [Micavibrio sp.]
MSVDPIPDVTDLSRTQKSRRTKIDFRFLKNYVEYTIRDSRGETASFNTRYEDLPGSFDYKTFQLGRARMLIPTLMVMLITIVSLMQEPAQPLPMLFATIGVSAAALAFVYLLQRGQKRVYTALPAKTGKLLVLRGKGHDEIIAELAERRIKALRRLAVIDPANTPMADYKKFLFLKEEGALTAEELEGYRLRLGIGAEFIPPKKTADGEPQVIRQQALRFKNEYSFFDKHLGFSEDDGAMSAFNVWYADLPPAGEYRRYSKKEPYGVLVFIAGLIVAVAILNLHANDNYYVGNEGLMRILKGALVFVPVLAGAVFLVQRYTRKEFTIVPMGKGVLRILQDERHDDLLGEIQRRRLGALREYAVVNHYNTPQAELKKFTWLKEQGAISGDEFEAFRRRIIDAVQETPPPAPPKPPRETLH